MLSHAEGTALTATTTGLPDLKTVPYEAFPAPSSTRLSSQFGDPNSGLRSITELSGSAVVVHLGGAIDAGNEIVWQRMVSRTASIAIAPGPFVIDIRALDFMGRVPMPRWPTRRCGVVGAALTCGWSAASQSSRAPSPHADWARLLPMYTSVENALSPPLSDRG